MQRLTTSMARQTSIIPKSAVRRFGAIVLEPGKPENSGIPDLNIPYDQLSIFARIYETSSPLVRMPVYAIAEIGEAGANEKRASEASRLADAPTNQFTGSSVRCHVPLGLIGTNHAGYASFDLTVLRTSDVVDSYQRIRKNAGMEPAAGDDTLVIRHLWVFPFSDPLLQVDALRDGDIGPTYVALRIELDEDQLAQREMDRPTVAMQNPNILDWRLSPGSFTLSGGVLVGDDGCETLLPSNLSTQQFRFRQIVRSTAKGRDDARDLYRAGYMLDYTTEFFSVGHSLGQLAYSLALAPGEIINLAFIDWSRTDAAGRSERTGLTDSLTHDTVRDRALTESVSAMLNEWQRGGSILAGAAASYGAMMSSGALGAAAALGASYSTSSGTRELSAETAQNISDSFHQATTAIRELRSTVIVQSDQAESSTAKTRVIANYNHCHAMTILYYEVLRHYRAVTRVAGSRPVVLVNYSDQGVDFHNDALILARRLQLETALLDSRLLTAFDALYRVRVGTKRFEQELAKWEALPSPADPGAVVIERMTITILTGDGGGTDGDIYFDMVMTWGEVLITRQTTDNANDDPRVLDTPNMDDFEENSERGYNLRPDRPIRWRDIRGFIMRLEGGDDWTVGRVKIEGFSANNDYVLLANVGLGRNIPNNTSMAEVPIPPPPPAPGKPPMPTVELYVVPEDQITRDMLVEHLDYNQRHYERAVWLSEDPNVRSRRLDGKSIDGHRLLDIIENRALEIIGDHVAFPINNDKRAMRVVEELFKIETDYNPLVEDSYVEQLMTLPARGVFAEAKLGHCNACEPLDDTRFWDWQKSPPPLMPTAIGELDTGTRAQAPSGLQPTAFPQSLVNIVNPQPLPDPTGLSDALKVMGTPDIFRDQSGLSEVGGLLKTLSDNATAMGLAAMNGGKQDGLLDQIRGAPELTDDQRKGLVQKYLANQVDQSAPEAAAPPVDSGVAPTPPSTEPPAGDAQPTPTSTPPTPTPKSTKPKRPNAKPPARGLEFLISFRRPVIGLSVTGTASVVITPTGEALPAHEGEDYYVPGETIGPPEANRPVARYYNNRRIENSSLDLVTENAGAPGSIKIDASYDVKFIEKGQLINRFEIEPSFPDAAINFTSKTLSFSGQQTYSAPATGNVVQVTAIPTVLDTDIEITTGGDQTTEYSGSASVEYIAKVEGGTTSTNLQTNRTTRKFKIYYLTGGLDIKTGGANS